jgi:predicted Zn-dependent peptidase
MSIASLWIMRGSSQDPKGKEGLSHYFEHLFLNKTKDFSNKIEALRKIDGLGLFYNAYTAKNFIHYYFIQETKNQEDGVKMLIEGLNNFEIDEKVFEREKEIIFNEQAQFTTNPSVYTWNLADKGLWPNSPLSGFGLGSKQTVNSITIDDIFNYKEVLFKKENLGFLTISSKRINTKLEKKLIDLTSPRETENEPDFEYLNSTGVKKIICEYRQSDTIFFVISFPLPSLKSVLKDKVVLEFIRNYLVSGWSSKLIERLRLDKNYTYWVFSGTEYLQEAGSFKISFSTSKKNIKDIVNIIVEEIEKLHNIELDIPQLNHHKNAMKAHIIKNFIKPENMLWWYGWNIFSAHQELTIGEYFDDIDRITAKEVIDVSRKYLVKSNLHIAALGDIIESDLNKIIQQYV